MKKFITIAAVAAFAVAGTVTPVQAATTAELIAQFQAQIAALTAGTTSTSMLSAHDGVNLKV